MYEHYNVLATSLCFVCMWVVSEALTTWQRYGMSCCHHEHLWEERTKVNQARKMFNRQIEHNCDSAAKVSG